MHKHYNRVCKHKGLLGGPYMSQQDLPAPTLSMYIVYTMHWHSHVSMNKYVCVHE